MDPSAVTELILSFTACAAVIRLFSFNLAREFPALLAYLAFVAVMNLGYGLLNPASALYFWSYVALEPLECAFSVAAVRELLVLTFNNYPGIRTVGRWVMYAGVAFALVASLLLTGFFWSGTAKGRAHSHLFYIEISQRSIVFALAFVILAILLFLSRYPLHLGRNTLVSSAFFSIVFLSEAVRLLIDSLAPQLNIPYIDWTGTIFMSICLVGWTAMLRPATEKTPVRVAFSTPQEEHLLQQLNALNQLLTRTARR